MRKNLTEMVFILDRSGSMSGLESETIGGFNGMLGKQKGIAGEALVSTVLFDHQFEVLHDRLPIGEVKQLTTCEYYVRGNTALFDAIGRSVAKIATVHKYAREEDRPEKTVFVIITDGMENASRQYGLDDVRSMIRRQKEAHGWEFLFLGANIDAEAVAESVGIDRSRAVNYGADATGVRMAHAAVNEAMSNLRTNASLDAEWRKEVDEDFQKRGKKAA